MRALCGRRVLLVSRGQSVRRGEAVRVAGFGMPRRGASSAASTSAPRGELVVRLHLRSIRASVGGAALRIGGTGVGVAIALRTALLSTRPHETRAPKNAIDRTILRALPLLGRFGKVAMGW